MSSGSRPGAADKKVVPEGTAIDTPEFTNIETVRTKPSVAKNSKGSARFGSANEAETESSKLFREETEKPEEENARAMEDLSTNLATAPCIIDPDSPHMRRWDLFIMALLVYTAFVTPYEVAFMETKIDFLFMLNRFIDLSFLGDMSLQFMLPFKPADADSQMQHFWVVSHKRIAVRYVLGWFIIDLISVFPFDSLGFILDGNVGNLKVLRIMRCARLIKLVRIIKASAMLQKLKRRVGLKYSTIKLIQFVVMVVVVTHWLSCLWMLIPRIEATDTNWIGKYYHKQLENVTVVDPVTYDIDASQLYLACLYWSIMTLTTIGYGDVTAATKGEMLVACFGMALGASVYAYIVGGICGILANTDPVSLEFNQTLDNLNNLMLEYKIPRRMKENLREFHFKTQSLFRARMHQTVLEVLSPELRNQVVAFINYRWISKVRLFKTLPAEERGNFMTRVTMSMTAQAYGPNEYVVRLADMMETMYIIKEGVCVKILSSGAQKMLLNGDVAGSDITIRTAGFRANFELKTITFVVTQELDRDDLQQILAHPGFKETRICLRKTAIKRLFKDCFFGYCKLFQSMHGLQSLAGGTMDPEARAKLHEATGKMLRKHEQQGETQEQNEEDPEDELHDVNAWEGEEAEAEDVDRPVTMRELKKVLAEHRRIQSEISRKESAQLLKKLSHRLQAGLATIKKK